MGEVLDDAPTGATMADAIAIVARVAGLQEAIELRTTELVLRTMPDSDLASMMRWLRAMPSIEESASDERDMLAGAVGPAATG